MSLISWLRRKFTKPVYIPPAKPIKPIPTMEGILSIVKNSDCAKYQWKDRGRAPLGYLQGVALTFARCVCQFDSPYVGLMSQKKIPNDRTDALYWYDSNFKKLGMNNDTNSIETLRHNFALLIGLGMRESSGNYSCGRDMSADFSSADSAEAGLFQASYGSRRSSPEFDKLFNNFVPSIANDYFKIGIIPTASNMRNWGPVGSAGYRWQAATKVNPEFATMWAAMLIRLSGGKKGEFGPLRTKACELRPEVDAMLLAVQKSITKEICEALK